METIDVKIVLKDGAKTPVKATPGSAGYDLYCPDDVKLKRGRGVIPLNIELAIPQGFAGIIKPRSGFEVKGFEAIDCYGNRRYIDCNEKDGVIDSDFRGIVGVIYENHDTITDRYAKAGTRIAQMIFIKVYDANFIVVDKLDETERGNGGYGSTGTN